MNAITAGAARDLSEGLPQIRQIFEKLLNGEHISRENHGLYKELRENHEAYMTLFSMFISEELAYHIAGFYYILEADTNNISDRSKVFAALSMSLIEQLGNRGQDATQLIDKADVVDDDFIDQLMLDQKSTLKQMNLHHRDEFYRTLQAMAKKGFIAFSESSIRPGVILLPPFHRYVDAARLYEKNHVAISEQEELV